jgi:hypothetical protein
MNRVGRLLEKIGSDSDHSTTTELPRDIGAAIITGGRTRYYADPMVTEVSFHGLGRESLEAINTATEAIGRDPNAAIVEYDRRLLAARGAGRALVQEA